MSRHAALTSGNLVESFRRTVADFEGSVAIGAAVGRRTRPGVPGAARQRPGAVRRPGRRHASSSPASRTAWSRRPRSSSASTARRCRHRAAAARCSCSTARTAGELAGVRRLAYDGTPLPIDAAEVVTAQVTTRDIDRGDSPHFLLKEIHEAPNSFRKTLRGKIVELDGMAARRRRRARAAAPTSPPGWRSGEHLEGARHRPGHRGRRRAQHGRRARRRCATARSTSTRSPPPSCQRLRPAARHDRHARSSPSARAAPPPTPTARSTWPAAVAPRCSPSSTAATATSPTRPTA